MQTLRNLIPDDALLAYGLAALAVVLAVVLLVLVVRLIAGRGLRPPGGRSRQPRLGIVDAFDLDRQRQLVLVRRDNVEHLLMIGGPNDVLIESAIVRQQLAVSGGLPEMRRDTPVVPLAPFPPPQPVAVERAPQPLAVPPIAAAAEPLRPAPPPTRVAPVPIPRPSEASARSEQTAPRPQAVAPSRVPVLPRAATPLPRANPVARSMDAAPPASIPRAEPRLPDARATPNAPEPADTRAPPPRGAVLGSLEEEMAKLLGRPSPGGP